MQPPSYYHQLCLTCQKIVEEALTTNTQEGYVSAQQLLKAELAKKSSQFNPAAFQTLADLKSNHEQVFFEFIFQCEEKREDLFSTQFNVLIENGEPFIHLYQTMYPGDLSTLASRIIDAAKRGEYHAKVAFNIFSRTVEENQQILEEIQIKIVPQDKL